MSADDVVSDSTDLQSLNRYSYVDNEPLSAVDPTGHDSSQPQGPSEPTPPDPGDWTTWGTPETASWPTKFDPSALQAAADFMTSIYAEGAPLPRAGTPFDLLALSSPDGQLNAVMGVPGALPGFSAVDPGAFSSLFAPAILDHAVVPVKDPIVVINGFNAASTVAYYFRRLVQVHPEYKGHIYQFSWEDFYIFGETDEIEDFIKTLSREGPVTLIGNSLGGPIAALLAEDCRCVTTLVTLDPVGWYLPSWEYDDIKDSVTHWIDVYTTRITLAPNLDRLLSGLTSGPWGSAPPGAIPMDVAHADFYAQMEAVCGKVENYRCGY
jgi:pimeloyl-ACP methyl ester carboxylesterase